MVEYGMCSIPPTHQAEVVRLMKSSPLGLVTAAIGDGGNDVSMIQVTDSLGLNPPLPALVDTKELLYP